ncbi:methylglyoxal reductase (NADPH-dependent) gre2 [Serendipita sp. 397]|nr:methylglyoxal reductase (NADPH-dependent) gre2 [Serendipita sp. 397]
MPAILPKSKVLLTGGSGFLGTWIIKTLLTQSPSFHVRAAVRSQQKAELLKKLFKDHSDNLELVLFDDISSPGALDEAVHGVQGIIHSASPLPSTNPDDDPQLHIKPAVEGTLSLLKSAASSESVKRVVITASMASALEKTRCAPDTWSNNAIRAVEQRGKKAPPAAKYAASKALAEKKAWEFMNERKPDFDLVTLLPSYIWGPVLNKGSGPEITGSNAYLLNPLKHPALTTRSPTQNAAEVHFVDVRDVAGLHVKALTTPEAGNERILVSAPFISWQHILNHLNRSTIDGLKVPEGNPSSVEKWKPAVVMSREKSEKILGFAPRPFGETIDDAVASALQLGWKQ